MAKVDLSKEEQEQLKIQRETNARIASVGEKIQELLAENNVRLIIDPNSPHGNPSIIVVSN